MQSIQSSILEQMILFNQLVTSICLNFFFFSNKEYKFERFFGEIESYSKWNCFKNLILRMYYFFPVSMHFSFCRIIILDLMIYLTEYWELNQGLRELRSFFFFIFYTRWWNCQFWHLIWSIFSEEAKVWPEIYIF